MIMCDEARDLFCEEGVRPGRTVYRFASCRVLGSQSVSLTLGHVIHITLLLKGLRRKQLCVLNGVEQVANPLFHLPTVHERSIGGKHHTQI